MVCVDTCDRIRKRSENGASFFHILFAMSPEANDGSTLMRSSQNKIKKKYEKLQLTRT